MNYKSIPVTDIRPGDLIHNPDGPDACVFDVARNLGHVFLYTASGENAHSIGDRLKVAGRNT